MTDFRFFANLSKDVFYLFFPKVCLSCGNILHKNERMVCHNCLSDFPFTQFDFSQNNPVYKLLSPIVNIQAATSLLYYNKSGKVQELIHQLKYRNQQEVGVFLGELLAKTLINSSEIIKIDYIVPVPLHLKKMKKRGYNQLTKFGKTLSQNINVSFREDILLRQINTSSQTKKTREERRKNVAKAFVIHQPEQYNNKHFLIIDDVLTTGATIEACAETILQNIPNAKVSIATMANVL